MWEDFLGSLRSGVRTKENLSVDLGCVGEQLLKEQWSEEEVIQELMEEDELLRNREERRFTKLGN